VRSAYSDYSFTYADRLDIGKVRRSNQDRTITCPEMGLFGVSDGMGGLRFGERTAELTASAVPDALAHCLKNAVPGMAAEDAAERLKNAIRMVSDVVFDAGNSRGSFDFGATLSCVLLVGGHAVFGNLGDSRGYVVRKEGGASRIDQVTTDHNLASELVSQGKITKEEAMGHISSMQLLRFIGMEPPAGPEAFVVGIRQGDRLLLCSDGLHGMLTDEEICEIVAGGRCAEDIAQSLTDAANAAGGNDNISAVVIEVSGEDAEGA